MNKVMRVLEAVVLILLGAVLLNLVQTGSALEPFRKPGLSSAEFIGIILTALAVILGALTIFIGGLAIVSWRTFDDRIRYHAEYHIRQRMNPSDPEFSQIVKDIKDTVLLEAIIVLRQEGDRDPLNDAGAEVSD